MDQLEFADEQTLEEVVGEVVAAVSRPHCAQRMAAVASERAAVLLSPRVP